jgi:hypothetical protein
VLPPGTASSAGSLNDLGEAPLSTDRKRTVKKGGALEILIFDCNVIHLLRPRKIFQWGQRPEGLHVLAKWMGFIRNDDSCEFHGDERHSVLWFVDPRNTSSLGMIGNFFKLQAARCCRPQAKSLFRLTSSNVESNSHGRQQCEAHYLGQKKRGTRLRIN